MWFEMLDMIECSKKAKGGFVKEYSNLSYSEILYLFSDQFVMSKKSSLAGMMCLAALLNLKDENLIRFEMKDVKKFFILKGKAVIVEKLYQDKTDLVNQNFSGIEKVFLENIIDKKKVDDFVRSLLPGELYDSPWDIIYMIVKENLYEKGFLFKEKYKKDEKNIVQNILSLIRKEIKTEIKEEPSIEGFYIKYIENEEKKARIEGMLPQVKQSFMVFKNDKGLYYKTLEQIESAIVSKYDRSDTPYNDD